MKIKFALTDSDPVISYDPIHRPGVSNLIEILSQFDSDGQSCEELALEHRSSSIRSLKEYVANTVSGHLRSIREKYFSLIEDKSDYLDSVADLGARDARSNANLTMRLVRVAVGL
jgi:tryptophanyl-tRNA synthetase